MQKKIKIIALFMLMFVGMSSVDAKTCFMRGKYKKGSKKITASKVDKIPAHVGASCTGGEYYYKINVENGKSELVEYWYCYTNPDLIVSTWTVDNSAKINGELKYNLDSSGEIDCDSLEICHGADDYTSNSSHYVTSNCGSTNDNPKKNNGSNSGPTVTNLCDSGSETIKLAKEVYTLFRFVIPVLVIIFSVIDFLKVVVNGDEKVYSEAWGKFIKRIIIGVIILLVPILLKTLLNMSNITNTYGNEMFCIFE